MRRVLAVALCSLPLALQESSGQDWPRQNTEALTAFQANRAKERPKMDKALVDLERKEDAWLAVARDVFGSTENTRMDPGFFERRRLERRGHMAAEDSLATALVAARTAGNAGVTLTALRDRRGRLSTMLVDIDSLTKEAKEVIRVSQRELDRWKGEDRPGMNPNQRQFVKGVIDWYDKLLRAARARVDYHGLQTTSFKTEITTLDAEIATAAAAAGTP